MATYGGYASRMEYLKELAENYDYGLPEQIVFMLANALGPNEDFDGLISELDDVDESILDAFE